MVMMVESGRCDDADGRKWTVVMMMMVERSL